MKGNLTYILMVSLGLVLMAVVLSVLVPAAYAMPAEGQLPEIEQQCPWWHLHCNYGGWCDLFWWLRK